MSNTHHAENQAPTPEAGSNSKSTATERLNGFASLFESVIKTFSSIKLAVFIILALASLIAWGTIVEAKYDATAAAKLVYQSVWMYSVIILLCLSLIAVMVDRWPWKARHLGFILAHIGIIVLMTGSYITHISGLDGSLTLTTGIPTGAVVTGATDFSVYASLDGSNYRKMFDREVDFFLHPPTKENPLTIEIPASTIRVTEYYPYAFRDEKIVAAEDENAGAAVRFELQNPNVNFTDWLLQPASGRTVDKDLGPAKVVFASGEYEVPKDKNVLVMRADSKGAIDYEIHTARTPKNIIKGVAHAGDTVQTPWMGIVLRILKFLPHAENKITFQKTDHPTEMTTSAVKVEFQGREQWLSLNAMVKLFTNEAVYIVTYANRRLDLGFKMNLREFKVGRYPGTMRAASYESVVDVPGVENHVISMNEPLKYKGFTFYQASFNEDPETGQPVASILSVNRDPGRWIKYIGSFLIVLGTIHLFWFKKKAARKAAMREASAQ